MGVTYVYLLIINLPNFLYFNQGICAIGFRSLSKIIKIFPKMYLFITTVSALRPPTNHSAAKLKHHHLSTNSKPLRNDQRIEQIKRKPVVINREENQAILQLA